MTVDGATIVKARIAALAAALQFRTGQEGPERTIERAGVFMPFLLEGVSANPGNPAPSQGGAGSG